MAEPSNVMLVLNRNHTLATNKGHIISFQKDQPTSVPRSLLSDALAIGAQPADGSAPDVDTEGKKSDIPQDPSDRNPLILAVIEKLIERNEREDFTAAGSPTVDAVSKELGFKVHAKEIAGQWQEYHDKQAADK